MNLHPLDWAVIAVYLIGMIALSYRLGRDHTTQRDYFLGGNRSGPLPIAISTMASQSSTNSMLGIPAFVGFTTYGGLVWLQGEVALPFAMIFVMAFLFPVFRSLRLISLYGYLDRRFGVGTRSLASFSFLVGRSLATGVTVYGVCLVLEVALNIPFWGAIILLGGVTVVYDILGGMRAVIWSDVIQIVLIIGAVASASWFAVDLVGGINEVFNEFDEERLRGLDFSGHGFGDGGRK